MKQSQRDSMKVARHFSGGKARKPIQVPAGTADMRSAVPTALSLASHLSRQ